MIFQSYAMNLAAFCFGTQIFYSYFTVFVLDFSDINVMLEVLCIYSGVVYNRLW